MGGGPSTPRLAAAVSNAGALGSLAVGYATPDQIREEIRATRSLTSAPFAVNIFTFVEPPAPPGEELEAANRALDRYRAELGLPLAPPLPARYAENQSEQMAVILDEKPSIFSFTFGMPPAGILAECQRLGIRTMGTATHVDEARALEAAGVDFIFAQGAEAGGHRGTFLGPMSRGMVGTMALVPQLVDAVSIPVIAAGGIADRRGVAAALALGADAVALGTAFLRCPEAGTSAPYRAALAEVAETRITRAFSGREARGVVNRFMTELADADVPPYPYQNALTRDVRKAATVAGRAEYLALWAGEGVGLTREEPAAGVVARLVVGL